jgi:hypothetical protein
MNQVTSLKLESQSPDRRAPKTQGKKPSKNPSKRPSKKNEEKGVKVKISSDPDCLMPHTKKDVTMGERCKVQGKAQGCTAIDGPHSGCNGCG